MERHAKQPARRVIFRSVRARAARLAVGLTLLAMTAILVLPALASDSGPPEPIGLAVGTDAIDAGLREGGGHGTLPSTLFLSVYLHGCENPATIEGEFLRSTDTWYAEKDGKYAARPEQALLTLTGARIRSAVVAVVPGDGRHRPHEGILRTFALNGKPVVVDNELRPLIHSGNTTTVLLRSPQWAQAMDPLAFVVKADLVKSAGLDSCYLNVPSLFDGYEPQDNSESYADRVMEKVGKHLPQLARPREKAPEQFPGEQEPPHPGPERLSAAETRVIAPGEVVQGSVGDGGYVTATGLRYLCHTLIEGKAPAREIDSRIAPDLTAPTSNPTCGGTPLLQSAGVLGDSTRRIFFGGITGALAATLIIEALFLGETEPAGEDRRRWRRPKANSGAT